MRTDRLAVLIDAENVSGNIADVLFGKIAELGTASARRIYGDFSNPCVKTWAGAIAKHAIIAQQVFKSGKNAADIALIIDAMDLLHSGRFNGFCIVSSDSDFAHLAERIREKGLAVFGFGKRTTLEGFRNSCSAFFYTEDLKAKGPGKLASKPA